jgi:hypothetical protein
MPYRGKAMSTDHSEIARATLNIGDELTAVRRVIEESDLGEAIHTIAYSLERLVDGPPAPETDIVIKQLIVMRDRLYALGYDGMAYLFDDDGWTPLTDRIKQL